MDKENKKSRKSRRFRGWFKKKRKMPDPFYLGEVTDWGEDEEEGDDDNPEEDDADVRSTHDPFVSTNELRVFVGTWNVAGRSPVGSLAVDVDEWLNLKDAADIYVMGFQEIVPLVAKHVIGAEDPTEATNWNVLLGKTLNDKYGCPWLTPVLKPIPNENYQYAGEPDSESRVSFNRERNGQFTRYKLMASKKMVGVFISVWIRRELLTRYGVSGVKVCSVACGIMGYLGNKGAIAVSMLIGGTSFCFVAAHLASGEKKGDEGRRNHQVAEIFKRTAFPRQPQDGDSPQPLTILGHDRIFWFGDLNYRLYLEDNLARELIKKQDWPALQQFDQLDKELEDGGVFQGWKEGNIEFAPTYKYSTSNCNRYSGGAPSRAGEKQRTPAWCDRILWYGKGVRQLSYFRSESRFSDHRPVSALFLTHIEPFRSSSLGNIPISDPGQSNPRGSADSTLFSLIGKDVETSSRHLQNCKSNRF